MSVQIHKMIAFNRLAYRIVVNSLLYQPYYFWRVLVRKGRDLGCKENTLFQNHNFTWV